MASYRPTVKRKKKERTWAEAATVALQNFPPRPVSTKEIMNYILMHQLKDIKHTKASENVLKTMLCHHANQDHCPFYKIKGKHGYYRLKDPSELKKITTIQNEKKAASIANLNKNLLAKNREKLVKRALSTVRLKQRQSDSLDAGTADNEDAETIDESMVTRRRASIPSYSNSARNKNNAVGHLDLETPNSALTNTKIKAVINSTTFSVFPPSYQYLLMQHLPSVDQYVDDRGCTTLIDNALNNEFFSQALQEWFNRLCEGEFTRETQARILSEISKERSKIDPWKADFFEEYYGQKTNTLQRTRSKSNEVSMDLPDLSFEAQLQKFNHLRNIPNLQQDIEEETKLKEVPVFGKPDEKTPLTQFCDLSNNTTENISTQSKVHSTLYRHPTGSESPLYEDDYSSEEETVDEYHEEIESDSESDICDSESTPGIKNESGSDSESVSESSTCKKQKTAFHQSPRPGALFEPVNAFSAQPSPSLPSKPESVIGTSQLKDDSTQPSAPLNNTTFPSTCNEATKPDNLPQTANAIIKPAVKRAKTRTLAEIKAQMKAKKAAQAAAGQIANRYIPMVKPRLPNNNNSPQTPMYIPSITHIEYQPTSNAMPQYTPSNTTEKDTDFTTKSLNSDAEYEPKIVAPHGSSPGTGAKLILKRKAGSGGYSVKLSPRNIEDTNSPKIENPKMKNIISPGSFTVVDENVSSKLTVSPPLLTKSPVFGEKPYPTNLPVTVSAMNLVPSTSVQPFMSNSNSISFADITTSTINASKKPISSTSVSQNESTKSTELKNRFKSASAGKSLLQMQELARKNQISSSDSEVLESESDNDYSASSADSVCSTSPMKTKEGNINKDPENDIANQTDVITQTKKENEVGSAVEENASSPESQDEHMIIKCVCNCEKLVLCKGCGAYTHHECLGPARLCSLCV